MYYVYVLRSWTQNKFYIGYTRDLERRIKEHNQGQCHTTHRLDNPELIFYEAFKNEEDAKRREKYFKTTKGKKTLKLMLQETLCPGV
ncbi:MAG: GIY-YIG nuclease family protein [Candidatus Omnitrophica bacterium]|nr:GIY-YIG nuclease family protein [Candidatus Omnitrophota bacterium]